MRYERGEHVLIVADDLTSAADAAAPFARRGADAEIRFDRARPAGRPRVESVDADTRRNTAEVAAQTIEQLLSGPLPEVVFKTVDSTMRGHIAAEIDAARRATRRELTIVAPAFPAEGRTTKHGVQYLDGRPVSRTGFSTDRGHPVISDDIIGLVPGALRSGIADRHSLDHASGIIVADAETDAHLDALVARTSRFDRVLWVGSPGLAAALARSLVRRTGTKHRVVPKKEAGGIVVVVGSVHEASRAQLEQLHAIGIHLDLARVPIGAARTTITSSVSKGRIITIKDTSTTASAADVRMRLSQAVRPLRESDDTFTVVATGGDTARAVLEALEINRLRVVDEPYPGVVSARSVGAKPTTVIMKAGGFGEPSLLRTLIESASAAPDLEEESSA